MKEQDAGRPLLAQDLGLGLPPVGDGLDQAELLDSRGLLPAIGGSVSGASEVVADRPLRDAQDSRRLALRLASLLQDLDRHDLLPCEHCQGRASERAVDVPDQLESAWLACRWMSRTTVVLDACQARNDSGSLTPSFTGLVTDPHQPQVVVERPRRSRPGQGSNDLGEQMPHRCHAQPLTGDAEAGAMGRLLALAQPPGVFEDLSDRQIGQQPHRQYHPQNDLVSQPTASRIDPASGRERLLNVRGADNLFQSRQAIQNPARVIGRQRAMSLWHASHSLLGALLVRKPKVTEGCDLRLFQRY